jgi:hypothetical protein
VDYITIAGVQPYDGRYELDLEQAPLTTREWGWVKRLSGYLPMTIGEEGFADPEFVAVLACVGLRRAGKVEAKDVPEVFERISDAPFGSTITLEAGDTEEGELVEDPSESSSVNGPSSGTASRTSSEPSADLLNPTGRLRLDTSVSVPVTSAS